MRLLARFLLVAALIAPQSAFALDPAKVPPITLGTGSSGDASAVNVTPSASAALGTLARSLADQAATLAAKAPLASPVFTGSPKMPALTLTDTGSTGDVSAMSIKPTGATTFASLSALFARTVYPEFWGAKGDGTTDDSTAILAAANSLNGQCGTVQGANGKRYRIGASFRLPPCVTLQGTTGVPEEPKGAQTSQFGSVGGLVVDSSATVMLNSASGIANFFVIQNGLTLPAPDSSAFAGTAISCAPLPVSGATRANGPFIRNVLVIGFAQALNCQNADRLRVEQFDFDSIAGIYSNGSFDSQYVNRARGWPYASVGFTGWTATGSSGNGTTATITFTPAATLRVGTNVTVSGMGSYNGTYAVTASAAGSVSFASTVTGSASGGTLTDTDHSFSRPGTAFDIDGQQDDTHITNALAFGYFTSFNFRAQGNVLGDMLWSDQVPRPPLYSVGFRFGNTIGRTSFGQLYANGSTYAVQSATTGGIYSGVDIAELFAQTSAFGGECINFANGSNGFVNIGNINIAGCTAWAADIAGAPNAYLRIGGGTIVGAQGGNANSPIIAVPSSGALRSNIVINDRNLRTDQALGASLYGNGQLGDYPMASAALLALPASGIDAMALSGTTTITTITGVFGGREITFVCTAACSFGTGGNIAFNGSVGFTGSAGAQIRLRYDANQAPQVWREISRMKP